MSLIIQTDCSVKTGTLNLDAFEAPIPAIIWEKSGICSFHFWLKISFDGVLRKSNLLSSLVSCEIWKPAKFAGFEIIFVLSFFIICHWGRIGRTGSKNNTHVLERH